MPHVSFLRLSGRPRVLFVVALTLFVSAGIFVSVDQLQAYHGLTQEIWGYVKNSSGSTVSGANVWYCYNSSATPPTSCTGYSPSSGASDAMGKWWHSPASTGYYRIWAVYNCTATGCESQAPDQTFYYSGTGAMQILDLVLSPSSSSTMNKIYGYVKNSSGQPVSGASVKYCYSSSATPTNCTGSPSSAGTSDSYGYWYLQNPAAGYYGFYAVFTPDASPIIYPPYYSSGTVQVGDLILSSSSTSTYTLTVYKSGYPNNGTVTSTPTGISCGTTCSYSFASGTSVTLNFSADPGYSFGGWSGNCTGMVACTLTMNQSYSATAQFNSSSTTNYTLTVNKNGAGNIYTSPPGANCGYLGAAPPCAYSYASGTSVTLTAQADTSTSGNAFTGWTGESCTLATCAITMSADRTITANFGSTTASANSFSGYVKDTAGAMIANMNVNYCTSTTPEPFPSCMTTFAATTGSDGKWMFNNPPMGFYYRFWVSSPPAPYLYSNTVNSSGSYSGGAVSLPDIVLASGTTSGPDLFLLSFGYSHANPDGIAVGESPTFFATVKNQGSATSAASSTRLRIDVNADGTWDVTPPVAATGSLAVGATEDEQWSGVWTAVAGTHTLEYCADATSVVPEANETNNCTKMLVTVGSNTTTAQLYGYVKTSTGGAVSGATVQYLWNATAPPTSGSPLSAGVTDATGRWALPSPAAGYYRFWAVGMDGTLSPYRDLPYGGTGTVQVFDLTLGAATQSLGYIYGYAFGPSGALGGATIQVSQDGGTLVKTVVTSSTGYYAVSDLPLGWGYKIFAMPPSGSTLTAPPAAFTFLSSSQTSFKTDFTFTGSTGGNATIVGRVVHEDGTAMGSVRVEAWATNIGSASTTTAADGTYKLSVAAGTWEVHAFVDPLSGMYGDPPSRRVSVDVGVIATDVNFTILRGSATISGRLVDEQTGAVVNVSNSWAGIRTLMIGAPISGGAFTFSVPAGSFLVEVWFPDTSGYVSTGPVNVTVQAGQSVSVDVKVRSAATAGGKIEGSVYDTAGNVVSGIGLEVFAAQGGSWFPGTVDVTTGKFSILVPAGTWSFGFRVTDSRYSAVSYPGEAVVVLAGQAAVRNITVTRIEGASLTVQLKKADGSAFVNGGVEVSTVSFNSLGTTTTSFVPFFRFGYTDTQGTAKFTLPPGTYYVRAFAPPELGFMNPLEQSLTLVTGDAKSVTLAFRTPSATITGRVLLNGAPVADAFVGGWSKFGGFTATKSKADGSYAATVISGDVWYIRAGANINGVFAESPPATVDMTSRSSAAQDLVLSATAMLIPPPLNATAIATQPFSAKLENGTQVACTANCFASSGQVNIVMQPDVQTPDQGGVHVIGVAYSVEAHKTDGTVVKQLNDEAVVSIPYDPSIVRSKGAAESDLRVGFFDDASGRWQTLESSAVDTVAKVCTAHTNHFTRFAIVTSAYATVISPAIHEGDLIRGPDGVKVYIVNAKGYKRHIFNPAVFSMYKHFTWDSIKDVSQQVLDSYAVSDTYRADGDPKVYSLTEISEAQGNAQKRWLDMAPSRFSQLGYNWDQVFIVNSKERDYYSTGTAIQ